MKKQLIPGALLILMAGYACAEEDERHTNTSDITYRGMPTLTSNPTSGTGIGATGIAIYQADNDSSPSQAILSGQYTNTDSYNLFAVNKMFFSSDRWQSNTMAGLINNNSQYDLPADLPPVLPPVNSDDGIKYNVDIYVLAQQFLYETRKHYYVGGQMYYVDQRFNALNPAGEVFLKLKGIENARRGGYGLTLSYDSRTRQEKFYPTSSSLVNLVASHFPEFMGIKQPYYNAYLDARKYIPGFKPSDVFAMQFYAQYSSENTPDGALPALGARNILRGFPIGLYKARHMLAGQGEYRYRIDNTRFRLTTFAGYASLSGGSKGTASGNRERDNGDYYSGGLGVHFILEKKQQLDYRVNVAYTNENETSIYAGINQAF